LICLAIFLGGMSASALAQEEAADDAKAQAPASNESSTEPADKAPASEEATPPEEMKSDSAQPDAAADDKPEANTEQPSTEQPVPEPVEASPEDAEAEEASPELPLGYKPPGVRPKQMTFEKELMTAEEEAQLATELKNARYKDVLRDGKLDATTTELLKKLARYDVYRMTMKKHRRELHKLRDELVGHMTSAASLLSPGSQRDAFRAAFLQEVVDRCKELLDGNFYARVSAALTLGHLDLHDYDAQKMTPPVPFAPALVPLMEIVNSDDQYEAVKIIAVVGIHRMAVAGLLSQTEKLDLANRMLAELKNPKSGPWYQMRLAEALGRIDLAVDRENRPFIIQGLTEVVADRGRHWVARSMAAKALGRAKTSANVNLNKVTFEIAQLARDMIEAYNKEREAPNELDPGSPNPEAFYWRLCFLNLYLAFRPENAEEKDLKFGLMQNVGQYKPVIESAYALIAPLARHVFYTSPSVAFPADRAESLDGWLKQNVPDSQSIAPNMPAIVNSQASELDKPRQ
jgi:hypothetical protein